MYPHPNPRTHQGLIGRHQTRRWADPEINDVQLRTEIIDSEVVFLGGIRQSSLPPNYGLPPEELPELGAARTNRWHTMSPI